MATDEYEISPLRSLDDFLLGSARFQIPNFKDLEKWGNRVVNNLLYYQTNYFAMAVIIFLLVGVIHPVKMLYGTIGIAGAFGLFYYFTNVQSPASQFTKKHPLIGVGLIISGGYMVVYLLDSVLVFLFGILLPICIAFVHASMRLRNIKNKLSNKIEMIGLKKTPMGSFLEALELVLRIGKRISPVLSEGPPGSVSDDIKTRKAGRVKKETSGSPHLYYKRFCFYNGTPGTIGMIPNNLKSQ